MQFSVYSEMLVDTSQGRRPLKDVILMAQCLWAVPWAKNRERDGITFHCKYSDAVDYVSKYLIEGPDVYSRPSDRPRLIVVSDWLYNWVSENGSLWTPLNFMSEAETYNPSVH